MSRTLFVSDIHLCQKQPTTTTIFLNFLHSEAHQCDALYLLGDIFEIWIGDDYINPLYKQIATALNSLPVKKFFAHGNRDFLLGQTFASSCGMTLLPEKKILTLYGQRILIMHGDTLCTHDKKYQFLRSKINQPWIKQIFLTLPVHLRIYMASKIRANSKQNHQINLHIKDVNQEIVETLMKQQKVNILIHGHTHNPAIHKFHLHGKNVQRAVLGAWYNNGSIIQVDSNGVNLVEFPV